MSKKKTMVQVYREAKNKPLTEEEIQILGGGAIPRWVRECLLERDTE